MMTEKEMVEKFDQSEENFELYQKALGAGFPWMHFVERIRAKVVALGFLPEEGTLLILPRYQTSADKVLTGMLACMESAENPDHKVRMLQPWEEAELETWKHLICCASASMFDAGVVAAYTHGAVEGFDPVVENGAVSLFGDVGIFGLREKSLAFIRHYAGEDGAKLMAAIGDAACVNLYFDNTNTEAVFKLSKRVREQYFRNACKAAYIAGAVFAERVAEMSYNGEILDDGMPDDL